MFRYRLRTLLIVLALGPPVLAGLWWAIRTGEIRTIEYRIEILSELLMGLAPGMIAIAAIAYVMARFAAAVTKH